MWMRDDKVLLTVVESIESRVTLLERHVDGLSELFKNATPPRVAPCPICGSTNNVHTHLDNVADRRNDAIANAVQIAMVKNATPPVPDPPAAPAPDAALDEAQVLVTRLMSKCNDYAFDQITSAQLDVHEQAILSHIRQQAERIAELTRNYNSLVLTSASEAATLEAERDALRAENERLKAWRTWGKDGKL